MDTPSLAGFADSRTASASRPPGVARIARQPWPFADAIDPGTAAVQLDLGGPSVVDLGQGAQLGDLHRPVRAQPGW